MTVDEQRFEAPVTDAKHPVRLYFAFAGGQRMVINFRNVRELESSLEYVVGRNLEFIAGAVGLKSNMLSNANSNSNDPDKKLKTQSKPDPSFILNMFLVEPPDKSLSVPQTQAKNALAADEAAKRLAFIRMQVACKM